MLIVCAQPVERPAPAARTDVLQATERIDSVSLSWRDAEDVIRGEVIPGPFRENQASKITVEIGSIDGQEVTGPVTLTVRPVQHQLPADTELFAPKNIDDHTPGTVLTATKQKGALGWEFEVTPTASGPHVIEVAFRTTRQKVARGTVNVVGAMFPPIVKTVFGLSLIVFAVLFGLSRMHRLPKAGEESPPAPPGQPPT